MNDITEVFDKIDELGNALLNDTGYWHKHKFRRKIEVKENGDIEQYDYCSVCEIRR